MAPVRPKAIQSAFKFLKKNKKLRKHPNYKEKTVKSNVSYVCTVCNLDHYFSCFFISSENHISVIVSDKLGLCVEKILLLLKLNKLLK